MIRLQLTVSKFWDKMWFHGYFNFFILHKRLIIFYVLFSFAKKFQANNYYSELI